MKIRKIKFLKQASAVNFPKIPLTVAFLLSTALLVSCGGGGGNGALETGDTGANTGSDVASAASLAEANGTGPEVADNEENNDSNTGQGFESAAAGTTVATTPSANTNLALNPIIVPGELPAATSVIVTDDLSAPETSGSNATGASTPALGAARTFTAHTQLDDANAHRFLVRSTFGPTLETVAKLKQQTPVDWISEQMQMTPTYMSDRLSQENFRWGQYVNVWWKTAIEADDQLRQRVAFALSEILVISAKDALGEQQEAVANYYDMLVDHAFGNYRDLLEAVTLSPVMGEYLSMKGNRKPETDKNIRPDENYARELLQLFSIGLVKLNDDGSVQLDENGLPAPTYDQDVIEAFAHVFTGWHFANVDDFRWPTTKDYISPMQPNEDYHDKGPKTLLDGFQVPAGQSAREDLTMALDNIFNHSNIGPFIVKQLIQRLVTSNPSPQYIRDIVSVFNDNGVGVRGSIGSVVSAILLHEEAFHGHILYPRTFGKLKEPVMRVTSLWRAFMPDEIDFDFNYAWAASELSQAPLNAHSVFNFFTPFFSQPGMIRDNGLSSPEFEIHDETSIINITNRLLANSVWSHNYKHESSPQRIVINIDAEVDLASDSEALLDRLNQVLMGGTMSDALRSEARALMDARDYGWADSQKVVEAIFLIVSSPESAVQL